MKTARALFAVVMATMFVAGCSEKADIGGSGLVRLDGGVYAFIAEGPSSAEGLGANAGFIVGNEAVLVIDSRYTDHHGRKLLESIRSVTDLPISYLVNTHYHPDHTWGNSVFRGEGAIILARPETKLEMERYTPVYMDYYEERKPDVFAMIKNVEPAYPDSMVAGELRLDLGGIDAVVYWFGPGHTAGDLVVWIPSKRIRFTGGLLSNGYHPNLGDQGADFENWLAILDRIVEMKPKIIVPGQGRVGKAEMVEVQRSYLVDLSALCIEAIRSGRSLSRSILEITVPETEGFLQDNILPFNIQTLYRKRVLDVVDPPFELDVPEGFTISDGFGGPDAGMIQWIFQSDEGYLEFETRWHPTNRTDVIVQDVYEEISRYMSKDDGLYNLGDQGTRKIDVGGKEYPAVYGRWSYRERLGTNGGGVWTWSIVLAEGTLYSMRMLTNSGMNLDQERLNLEILEHIVPTFRTAEKSR